MSAKKPKIDVFLAEGTPPQAMDAVIYGSGSSGVEVHAPWAAEKPGGPRPHIVVEPDAEGIKIRRVGTFNEKDAEKIVGWPDELGLLRELSDQASALRHKFPTGLVSLSGEEVVVDEATDPRVTDAFLVGMGPADGVREVHTPWSIAKPTKWFIQVSGATRGTKGAPVEIKGFGNPGQLVMKRDLIWNGSEDAAALRNAVASVALKLQLERASSDDLPVEDGVDMQVVAGRGLSKV